MKEKVKNAVKELMGLGVKGNPFVEFNYKSKDPSKTVNGRVFFNSVGMMEIKLTKIKGYNEKYVNRNAKRLFIESVLPYPKTGDIVWMSDDGGIRTPGETYALGDNSYYYGVGSSLLNCGGRRFYEDVKANYVRKDIGTCSPGFASNYNLFKLL